MVIKTRVVGFVLLWVFCAFGQNPISQQGIAPKNDDYALLKSSLRANNNISPLSADVPGPRWVGWTLLGTEYIAGSAIASQYWWKDAFAQNPFANIHETEPYFEDKMWHFWNGENITDFHYWTLRKFFAKDSPALAMGLTFITLTGVELMDASSGARRWGLSLNDCYGNIGGILFWYLKHEYPEYVPIDIRVGIRRWDKFLLFAERAVNIDASYNNELNHKCSDWHLDNYSILKIEAIVRPYDYFYVGGAASLQTDSCDCGIPDDLFGVTVGFDVIRHVNDRKPNTFSPLLDTFGKYFSLSVSYTHWWQRR